MVLPPVPPDDLLPWTASADVTFVGQPPRTLNQRLNLPNKLFESLMAGVPVVVSADNAQCRLTSEEGVGACADIDSPRAIADALASILGQPAGVQRELRAHCRSVALDRYSWERNVAGLTGLYRRLAETRPARHDRAVRAARCAPPRSSSTTRSRTTPGSGRWPTR